MTEQLDRRESNSEPLADPPGGGRQGSAGVLQGQSVGPYTLVDRLGGGAMATVYRAVDGRTQRLVALKVLLADADTVMRERFRREAHTHSNLIHPNIVRILDVGQLGDADLTYMAMDLVDGPNLGEAMEETRRMPLAEAARLLEPIALALHYASRQGVIHRDVKPSNILLGRVPQYSSGAVWIRDLGEAVVPLLSDFGIARALDAPELTNAGRTIGTPTYMSPEQCADSHEIDGRSDLYSLGAVFYRCVVGRPPFGGTTTQILHAHVYEPLTIPEDVLAGLSPLAVMVLQRTLAKDPAQRYATGGELAADLRAVAAGAMTASDAIGDPTATMPSLPSVRPAGGQAVLVPGMELQPPPVSALRSVEFIPAESYTPTPATPVGMPLVKTRRRWVGALMGGMLAILVLAFGGGLALNLLPDELIGRSPTPTLPGNAVTLTGAPTATAPLTAVRPAVTDVTQATDVAAPSLAPTLLVPVVAPTATRDLEPTASPPIPTPSGEIASYWEDAKGAYDDHAWQTALDLLTLVRRIDANYRRDEIDAMLFDIQVGLAAGEIVGGNLDTAAEYLGAAVALRPDVSQVVAIQRALQALVSPNALNKVMARWTLATELLKYGQTLLTAGNPCAAAEQFQAASSVLPDSDVAPLLAESQAACSKARSEEATRDQLAQLTGRLLYSTQEGDRYQIYRADVKADAASTLTIEDGAQPARQRSGNIVAFHSTSEAAPGIATFDLAAGLAPSVRSGRITTAPEDARDAPPSWDASDRELAFSSTVAGDRRARVNLVDTQAPGVLTSLGLGLDPAWHPSQDRIVYNGLNEVGTQPGLWLMDADGSARSRLTDNGNDRRPVWTPDGRSVVFMSSRDGNWEVYQVTVESGALLRLTNDQAQDGLPALSPDGKWVAFASDRGGFWRVWVTPIDGGDALPLVTLKGVLKSWLEHAIQWIP